ncbi:BREX-2 system adenine-specific DNA-methyltransferase PglX [Streptomyces sp. NBC_01429]|uniref:BREX-2 system adenine-specific DNA-methyltransferase PglX n=1 Tax=Streptomyces sp. NBC_01429 TaxID=2903862 RepID=UPI002E2B2B8C|nr:BREX-2 system adenine-specific DNA-methyltransferase PglX [Streptomyces sp. NBC_01429]
MDKAALLKDLRKQVTALEDDLRARTESEDDIRARLEQEYEAARAALRTAATYGAWRDERVTQAAAAWILACVFVRFCEDNRLIDVRFLAGPGEGLADAEDRHAEFFRTSPELNDRDWLEASFTYLAGAHEAAAGLFDKAHNPLWELSPSYGAATRLLQFWRARGADGEIVHDFTQGAAGVGVSAGDGAGVEGAGAEGAGERQDERGLDTRFLGDLYQDLSEHARKTYALLQTPEFVEEFILDLTLEPAVEAFGLEPEWKYGPVGEGGAARRGLRCIDPACGSGHFLLGMFRRLLEKWRALEPGTQDDVLIRRALESVHGCDKNPFAVAIARFRLLVAALGEYGETRLAAAPGFPINVAVGDSLLHGRDAGRDSDPTFDDVKDAGPFLYRTEDVREFKESVDLLGRGSYHVVVGNPPYITVKDKQENENYRRAYFACAGKYALSVPFAQRIFELAVRGSGTDRAAGFTGQITSNSFMKREFGKVLIESFLHGGPYKDPVTKRKGDYPGVDLSHVIDTSGAFIPGHGTPTVILAGRNRTAMQGDPVRAVLGVRGEPNQPEDPAHGLVWRAIVEQVSQPGYESGWVSVVDRQRGSLSEFPWSLSGGGASDLNAALDAAPRVLGSLLDRPIGFASFPGQDEVFFLSESWFRHHQDSADLRRELVIGEVVRDWREACETPALVPYDEAHAAVPLDVDTGWGRHLWTMRRVLGSTTGFGGDTRADSDEPWWTWYRWVSERYRTPLSITFAFVATHNHFVLDRGGRVFNRSAPVIKLPERATEDEHLALLGVLNSSTACFWLKQVSQGKGGSGLGRGLQDEEWEERYEFTGTKLQEYPLPADLSLNLGRLLDSRATSLAGYEPSAITAAALPTRLRFDEARTKHASLRAQMIAIQEELDWTVYGSYNLLTPAEVARTTLPSPTDTPEVALGERAFEIVLARKVAAGDAETAWFARHGSTPVTEIPVHWPDAYKAVVQARIDIIASRKDIALIERPECKRRWSSEPWEKKEKEALRAWLLDRCEDEKLWFGLRDGYRAPRTLTVSQLADALRTDADVVSVAELYAADHLGKRDATLATVLAEVIAAEHVPYLAALRYKDSGLRKRAEWEQVWELQREEDKTGERLDIAVPPKYSSADFLKHSYWSHRGKLDVPKERFVSYPDASPDSDPTLLLGWAGWDHKDQVQALVNLVNDRTIQADWQTPRIAPLLAGIQELMPWVRQWHGEHDEEWGGTPAEEYQAFQDEQLPKHGLSVQDLAAWRPEKKTRGTAKKNSD